MFNISFIPKSRFRYNRIGNNFDVSCEFRVLDILRPIIVIGKIIGDISISLIYSRN